MSVLLPFFFTLLEVKQFCQPPWLAPGCASCHQMLLSVGCEMLHHQMQKQKMWEFVSTGLHVFFPNGTWSCNFVEEE
jgi:mannose/fructose/N-acetylgalactosamine-specific phosphotransferase system component IIC